MWRIVLIDDDFQTLEGMKEVIPWSELDAECVGEALDGEEGLSLIKSTSPDLVITDIYMPNMDGLEMIHELRSIGFEGKVIILSGYSDFEYARKALQLQVIDYLTKPVSPGTLAITVNKAIEQLTLEKASKAQEEGMAEKVTQYEQFAMEEWLRRLLVNADDASKESMPAVINQLFQEHAFFKVAGIEIVRTDRLQSISPLDLRLFRYGLQNIVKELMEQSDLDFIYVDLHSHTSALIIYGDNSDYLSNQRVEERLIHIKTCASEYLKLMLRIGAGSIRQGMDHLNTSMQEAFRAVSFCELEANGAKDSIAFYEDGKMKGEAQRIELIAFPFYQKIAESLRLNQKQAAEEALNGLILELRDLPMDVDIRFPQLAAEFGTIVRHALFEVGIATDSSRTGIEIEQTKHIQTLYQFHEKLNEWIGRIADVVASGSNLKHKQIVDFILQYVNENYAEDIGTSDLAEKMYLSRNHVGNIFRSATGETFTAYLIKFRMEKARELILSGKYLVYEVAEKVGYKNVPYFSFLFKKHTGNNPSDLFR